LALVTNKSTHLPS